MSARRAVAFVLLVVCCAGGAFAVGRQLRRTAPANIVPVRFTPPALRLQAVYSLSQMPGMRSLATPR